MHHMVTTEHPAKRRRRKRSQHSHRIPGAGQKARAFRRAAVRRLQDQPAPTVRSHSRALSNPATACPARRASPSNSPIRRTSAASSTAGRSGGTMTGPRAALAKARPKPPWARAVSITSPARAQPDSPSGQRCNQVRHQRPVRPDDEADHPLLRQPLARDDAAAQRAGFRFVVRRLVRDRAQSCCASCAAAPASGPSSANQCARAAMITLVGGRLVHRLGADDLDQLVRGQVGQVVQRLHVLLAERHQHRRGQHLDGGDVVADAQLDALLGQLGVAAGDERLGAADQLGGDRSRRSPRSRQPRPPA